MGFLRTSRDLKTESVVLGFRETNWKPFEGDKSLSFFFQAKFSFFSVGTSFGILILRPGERGEICHVPLTLNHVMS